MERLQVLKVLVTPDGLGDTFELYHYFEPVTG
jgi:hypothetical protein